jgi:septum formation protein
LTNSVINLPIPLILASQSPRRAALLRQLKIDFEIITSNLHEEQIHRLDFTPAQYVEHLACEKAIEVAGRVEGDTIVVGADTTVILNNEIINKPITKEHAFAMLKSLSNNTHEVFTGVALVRQERVFSKVQRTLVTFRELDDDEILSYIESGSPMDKAGAYGIQDDFGAVFVKHIEGCYYNIVGLPLEMFYSMLKEFLK